MKLDFFDVDEFCKDVIPITSNKIYSKKGFHVDGLFSERIFGPVRTCTCGCGIYHGRSKYGETCSVCGVDVVHSNVRRKRFAKIELPFEIINPIMHYLIAKVGKTTFANIIKDLIFNDRVVGFYFSKERKKYVSVKRSLENQNDEQPPLPDIPDGAILYSGHTGAFELIKYECEQRKDSDEDWNFIYNNLHKFYIQNIIVPPPEFRPVSKTKDVQMRDEINKYFMTILNFSLMMKEEHLESVENIEISQVNFRNLQRHVFDLYEFIFSKFSKKTGLIRGFILGKRIDFSGRAVICPDPTLSLDECSIPYLMALELFKLDIINILLEKRWFKRYDPALEYIDRCIEIQDYALLDIVEQVSKKRYAMLNRQPTLHRMSMMAFKVTINCEYVIKIHPLICEPYNADFDGDQMAIYLSLYPETEKECKEKLSILSNIFSPSTGNLITGINQDIILGLYLLTKENSKQKVEFDGIQTYKGRVAFNKIFPDDWPFLNRTINKKELVALLNVLARRCEPDVLKDVLDKIKELGFKQTTIKGTTMSLKSMKFSESYDIVSTICDDDSKTLQDKFFALQSPEIMEQIHESFPYSDFIESGSRGSWDQAKQLMFCRGFVSNSKGEIVPTPVKNNLITGLNREEFFISSYGSRKALLDVALNTGVSGYLTRKLVYCAVNLELDDNLEDCGTSSTFNILIPEKETQELDPRKLARSLVGRWIIENENGEDVLKQITYDNYLDYVGKQVRVRSPIFCQSSRLCKRCYGETYKHLHSKYVGIIAAQAAGEVATQLTLRTFHVGGIAQMTEGQKDTTQKDIINDLSIVKKMLHGHGKNPYDEIVLELFKIYVRHRPLLLVHFECIVSQMMRIENQRWRLTPDRDITKYELVSIENVPSKESFLLALAFSKPYNYIVSGILGSTDTTDGILERIMLNEV